MLFSEVETFRRSVFETARFVYQQSLELVFISIAWFLISLPMFTVGVATLGAYAAIISLRETGAVDVDEVRKTVRSQFVPALVLGWLPGLLTVTWVTNVSSYVRNGDAQSLVLSIAVLYFLVYTFLVLVASYLELVGGTQLWPAFKQANMWVRRNPVLSILTAAVTLLVFVTTALLTVAFVLLFPAIAFSLHVHVYDTDRPDANKSSLGT
jgi:hypothetical protein